MNIDIKVDADGLEARLAGMGATLRQRLAAVLDAEAFQLQDLVKQKLTGEALKTQTGRLRRSINVKREDTSTALVRSVGTNVVYARIHEYGFDGVESVRAHTRRITQVFGRPIPPAIINVRAHTRHMVMPERSFLRSALQERAPSIREAIIAAVREAVQ